LMEKPFADYIHPDDRKLVAERHARRLRGEALPGVYPFRVVDKTGHNRWVEITVASIEWEGRPATLNFLADITDRKQTEAERDQLQAQLLQAQKMEAVGRLAGGVAHDFNNKLTVILGYAQLAMAGLERTDPLHENLRHILKAGKQSADIVRQLLAFARKQVIEPEVLDLNETVEDMLKMLHRIIGEDIDLVWSPGHDLWRIRMDPAQIDQILANLCVNARDAISGVGTVSIGARNVLLDDLNCAERAGTAPGEYVMLTVSDNGCGMDRDTQENIFEPFFTTKEVGKGTGLGLSTVYGIVKQNNGFIEVESEPGRGSTFRIYLPRHMDESEKREQVVQREIPRGHGETILVVEDETPLLELTRMFLERLGYAVITSERPEDAVQKVLDCPGEIHLLMIDVVLPGMSGKDLAEEISRVRPGVPTLFMSGYPADVIARQGVLDSGVPFIEKPFTFDNLARKVREAMGSEEGRVKKEERKDGHALRCHEVVMACH